MKQIQSVAKSLAAVGLMAVAGGVVTAYQHGEIKTYLDIGNAIKDAGVPAIGLCFGWILIKSPWATKPAPLESKGGE